MERKRGAERIQPLPPLRAQIRGIPINTLQFCSCFTKGAGILRSGLLHAGRIGGQKALVNGIVHVLGTEKSDP